MSWKRQALWNCLTPGRLPPCWPVAVEGAGIRTPVGNKERNLEQESGGVMTTTSALGGFSVKFACSVEVCKRHTEAAARVCLNYCCELNCISPRFVW